MIGSVAAPGAIGTRYAGFAVLKPGSLADDAPPASVSAAAAATATNTDHRARIKALPLLVVSRKTESNWAQWRDAAARRACGLAAGARRRCPGGRARCGRSRSVRPGEGLRLERELGKAERARARRPRGRRPARRQELEHEAGDHLRSRRHAVPALRPAWNLRERGVRLE